MNRYISEWGASMNGDISILPYIIMHLIRSLPVKLLQKKSFFFLSKDQILFSLVDVYYLTNLKSRNKN